MKKEKKKSKSLILKQDAYISTKLTNDFGEGFTETNLKCMRQFYLLFPKGHALRDELSWTHYRILQKKTGF
jgi:hypothetical protein